MSKLPDFEALAIFAKVVENRSFAGAAAELSLSKATVSKAVSRLEARLGARLFNRTSRRLALTDTGRQLSVRAAALLAEGEAAENEALAQSVNPRGLVRLATLPDSSLVARRLCSVTPYLVAAPTYLAERGTPKHPLQLAEHSCIGYAYLQTPNTWRFTHKSGEVASVRTAGPLRVNNGDAM